VEALATPLQATHDAAAFADVRRQSHVDDVDGRPQVGLRVGVATGVEADAVQDGH
jgi:hypothetical protein